MIQVHTRVHHLHIRTFNVVYTCILHLPGSQSHILVLISAKDFYIYTIAAKDFYVYTISAKDFYVYTIFVGKKLDAHHLHAVTQP